MRCYRHRDNDAIAVCQNCGKATCADCCDDTGSAVACGADCAAEVQRSYDLKRQLMQSFGVGMRPPMPASVPTYFFFGMILLAIGSISLALAVLTGLRDPWLIGTAQQVLSAGVFGG